MHIESQLEKEEKSLQPKTVSRPGNPSDKGRSRQVLLSCQEEKELEEIFIRTYGKVERR